jgi:hypothetical protein
MVARPAIEASLRRKDRLARRDAKLIAKGKLKSRPEPVARTDTRILDRLLEGAKS